MKAVERTSATAAPLDLGGQRTALHLATLGTWAVTQPVLEQLGLTPTFLFVRGANASEVVLFAVLLTLGIAGLFALVGWAVRRWPRPWQPHFVTGLVAVLGALIALPPLRRHLPWAMVSVVALSLGVVVAWAYGRWRAVRVGLSILSVGMVLVPLIFLLRPGIRAQWAPAATPVTTHEATGDGPPVVLVVFDELPLATLLTTTTPTSTPATTTASTAIDETLFPHFAAFADEATWFAHTISVGDATFEAVPAILTGRYPRGGQMPSHGAYPESLFSLMADDDALIEEVTTRLCPPAVCPPPASQPRLGRLAQLGEDAAVLYVHQLMPAAWARRLLAVGGRLHSSARTPHRDSNEISRPTARVSRIEHMLEALDGSAHRRLIYLHILLPHVPYEHLPSGLRYRAPAVAGGLIDQRVPHWGATAAYQRHILQAAFADRVLGRLLDRLRAVDLYDRAVIAIVADHGRDFEPGTMPRSFDGSHPVAVAAVPWLIKAPGQRTGRVDLRGAETIDILPTLAAMAGVEIPWPVDGRSLAEVKAPGRRRFAVYPSRRTEDRPQRFGLEIFDRLAASVARKQSWLCAGPGARCPYQVGAFPSLFDRPVASLPVVEIAAAPQDDRLVVELADPAPALNADPAFVPAVVSGRLAGPRARLRSSQSLAFALHGRIAGLTTTEDARGRGVYDTWTAVLDERAFRFAERNAITVFAVSGTDQAPRLERLAIQ